VRKRDEAQRDVEEVGWGGRWRAGGDLRGEGGSAKQEREEHDTKGERW